MAENKGDIERAELHRTIWNIANELRGSFDGWDLTRLYNQNTLCSLKTKNYIDRRY